MVSIKQRMAVDEPTCGLDAALTVLGGKWKPLILYRLRSGPKRFGDLKRLVAGISEKVLIQQLRELTVAGVLVRHNCQQVPPTVDYTMTAFGMTLVQALLPLCDWGTEHRGRFEEIMLSRTPVRANRAEPPPAQRGL